MKGLSKDSGKHHHNFRCVSKIQSKNIRSIMSVILTATNRIPLGEFDEI